MYAIQETRTQCQTKACLSALDIDLVLPAAARKNLKHAKRGINGQLAHAAALLRLQLALGRSGHVSGLHEVDEEHKASVDRTQRLHAEGLAVFEAPDADDARAGRKHMDAENWQLVRGQSLVMPVCAAFSARTSTTVALPEIVCKT